MMFGGCLVLEWQVKLDRLVMMLVGLVVLALLPHVFAASRAALT